MPDDVDNKLAKARASSVLETVRGGPSAKISRAKPLSTKEIRKGSELHEIEKARQVARAMDLRIMNVPYEKIAEICGYKSKKAAYSAIKRQLKKMVQEPAKRLYKLELERLDKLSRALWPKVKEGDSRAISSMLKVMDRRAKMVGLDKPVKITPTNIEGDKPYLSDAREKLVSQLFATVRRNADPESSVKDVPEGGGGAALRLEPASEEQSDSAEG